MEMNINRLRSMTAFITSTMIKICVRIGLGFIKKNKSSNSINIHRVSLRFYEKWNSTIVWSVEVEAGYTHFGLQGHKQHVINDYGQLPDVLNAKVAWSNKSIKVHRLRTKKVPFRSFKSHSPGIIWMSFDLDWDSSTLLTNLNTNLGEQYRIK